QVVILLLVKNIRDETQPLVSSENILLHFDHEGLVLWASELAKGGHGEWITFESFESVGENV
ncbi:MAG: hypothetical protein ACREF0_07100, partial [Acetobacteraceae bacterium]